MNNTSPEPLPEPQPQPKKIKPLIAGAVLALGMAAAIAFGGLFSSRAQDTGLSQTQIAERAANFTGHGMVSLPIIGSGDQDAAINEMALPEAQTDQLKSDIQAGKVKLVWLTLWDDMAEDGDIVQVESAGYSASVLLTNAPQRVALPLPGTGVVNLTGTKDGGGGITLAVMSGSTQVAVPVLQTGQSVGIPVVMQ